MACGLGIVSKTTKLKTKAKTNTEKFGLKTNT